MHLLAIGLSLFALSATANVAPCEKAAIGHGRADWRGESMVAGPVGVRRNPLGAMSRVADGLVAKMPILVEGREPDTVTISVPPQLRGRVFLYYGEMRDRDGKPTSSFVNNRGYDETEFQLCGNKPRTIWPGGIRVKGTAPVELDVSVAGRERPYVLQLGRPRLYAPPSS
jgi:hypothetical protein